MLTIYPIKPVKTNNYNNFQQQRKKTLVNDVFIRTTPNISFKGTEQNERNSFIEWAEKTDFLKSQLPYIFSNPDCKIGSGFFHAAYSIPGNDEYILRIPKNQEFQIFDFSNAIIKDKEDKNLRINIGQEVATIELPKEKGIPTTIEILKKQKGKAIGIPPLQTLFIPGTGVLKSNELPYDDLARKEYYASTIHKVAQLPISAYEKLISDIREAEKFDYHFDHLNSNNLLIDEESGVINIIDMEKMKVPVFLGDLLYALTNMNYFSTFSSQHNKYAVAEEMVNKVIMDIVEIIDKFIQAMRNKGEKFNREECAYEFFRFMSSLPFELYCRTCDDNEKWKILSEKGVA